LPELVEQLPKEVPVPNDVPPVYAYCTSEKAIALFWDVAVM
jgi:hypothetical protein